MTAQGWILMTLSIGFVCGLLGWSLWKIFSEPNETQHLHSQADIDPHDRG